MVDFRSRLGKKQVERPIDPIALYETLDRASDKGPLRPAQESVLKEWHSKRRADRDLIIKLHTGQGKTLIGLLLLQSRLNEGIGPALYLCPNNFLVNQTLIQAKQFGIHCVTADGEIPGEFIDGKTILIASVQKLFNGLTKFGLSPRSQPVGVLLMDDSHACIDAIRQATRLALPKEHPAYAEILSLFSSELRTQGVGSYADIEQHSYNAFLPVPYWDWDAKHTDVARILAKHTGTKEIKFVWPLIKDILGDCLCIVSGAGLEISPYLPPLHMFGSYDKANHRVFMSATVTNDSFLIKGLRLGEACITKPLTHEAEKWSGEKMVLIPSLIAPDLDRARIVKVFAEPNPKRQYGVVALTPSFRNTGDWEGYKAVIAQKQVPIEKCVEDLLAGQFENTVVFANRYDGIDLPDESCRILVFDSLPFAEELIDRYVESCRGDSVIIKAKQARIIEQGLGRAVRGEKDYCIVIITGPELVKMIRSSDTARYFSSQTRTQIEIGLDVAEYAKEDEAKSKKERDPLDILKDLVAQCLKRDDGWKEFYVSRMDSAPHTTTIDPQLLKLHDSELRAEERFQGGDRDGAIQVLQTLIDQDIKDASEKGWYLQEIARYWHRADKIKSNTLQVAAHRQNRYLLKPREGMEIAKISLTQQKRIENVVRWVKHAGNHPELMLRVEAFLTDLAFGVDSDRFEQAFHDLGEALGFECQRPDKEWKEGPDNLWAITDDQYLLAECKSEVDVNRESINKHETGQMNNAIAWFKRNYPGAQSRRLMIIPTKKVNKAAGFNEAVEIMRQSKLEKLVKNVRRVFMSLKDIDFQSISADQLHAQLKSHGLDVEHLAQDYAEPPFQMK